MRKRVKELWVAALRSAEYVQGKRRLQTEDGKFCCLGVLCDVYSRERAKQKKRKGEWKLCHIGGLRFVTPSGESSPTMLPGAVRRWAGLKDSDPHVEMAGSHNYLSTHNDCGEDFSKIAAAIEAQL